MTDRNFDQPFEHEEMERSAQSLCEIAIDQGSGLGRDNLMPRCRALIDESLQKLRAAGDQPAAIADDEADEVL
jgi:hypothetical protein